MSKRRFPLYLQIIIGLVAGIVWSFISIGFELPLTVTTHYIKPIGTIFVNLLKMIAVPLVLASLIVGVSGLNDTQKLARIGSKTIGIYLLTTIIAISIGLVMANIIRPGDRLPAETRDNLMSVYNTNVQTKLETAENVQEKGILQPLVDMVPENITQAAANNTMMLQVVFFAMLFGIALINIPREKRGSVISFFEGFNEVILKMVDYIMYTAPYGVFALIATLMIETAGDDLSKALDLLAGLGWYSITVLIGLGLVITVVYPIMVKVFAKFPAGKFLKGIRPAQLVAFSTSSSSATLPVTIQQCEKELGIKEEISSFVLPVGATINMDGTSLYQGVAAVFIAQALGIDLTIGDQLMIVLTATLASIGSAGVPGAGMVMLVVVLQSIGVPVDGIALILAVDRILDMCRTTVNVTGDAAVALIINHSENKRVQKIKKQEASDASIGKKVELIRETDLN
ncbi:dicarboxylate/amino acid:cation symporter [Cytophagales bacterium LB-30]|uniref:Dicarboxylate/amino acid:cation symporter n=1 Tax=Shiella aurantiaca TaxID=3058365 RepID=A0ABT8F7D5_9BACT|nr:dicarboxylate/amino acid:cation symporter [Shiella aurantiaca]MDN4166392.1 dicarboxylate/amino acid:cation symporter [Shiella aurantiaca]